MRFSFLGFHLVFLRVFGEEKECRHFHKPVFSLWGDLPSDQMSGDIFNGLDLDLEEGAPGI